MNGAKASLLLVRDFVNTFDAETNADSLAESGLVGRTELAQALEVREALRALLMAHNGLAADVDGASRLLDRAARRSRLTVRFASGAARVHPRRGLGGILAATAEAMSSPDWPRLNARYGAISVSVPPGFRGSLLRRLVESQLIVDESWAVSVQPDGRVERGVLLGAGATLWIFWTTGTVAGAVAGEAIGDPNRL